MSKRAKQMRGRRRSAASAVALQAGLPGLELSQSYDRFYKGWVVLDGQGAVVKRKRGGPYRDVPRA